MNRIYLNIPNQIQKDTFLKAQKNHRYSYPELEGTKGVMPNGYNHDINEVLLGHGQEVFEKARQGIEQWIMFPNWVQPHPKPAVIKADTDVALFFKLFGIYWNSACRIVYTVQEPNRFGFAYGTLASHVEKGEELFWVEKDEDGSVWYRIKAFSRPQYWMASLFKPIARMFQFRFVKDSKQQMVNWVKH